jgi:tight adherence protein B
VIGVRARRRLRGLGIGPARSGQLDAVLRRPRLVAVLVAAGAGTAAGTVAGPVGGGVATVYALIGVVFAVRRRATRLQAQARSAALDALAAFAADLRAGQPVAAARAAVQPLVDPVPLVSARIAAAGRVADGTGAPLADLLDRLETDLRALERVRQTAAAHAAGTRATAVLLAVLPVAGIGLGYAMGADPLRVLLHTPVGAGCVVVAVLLQLAGLAWTARAARIPGVAA